MLTLSGCHYKGRFFFAVVALAFTGVLLSSFVYGAQALGVNAHSMALGINPDGTPIVGNIYLKGGWVQAQFSTEDEKAYVWMNLTLDERMTITVQWRFPNSSMYQIDEKPLDKGSHTVWFFINIKNYPPAHVLSGAWKVEILAEQNHLFTEEFVITQAPTFQWTSTLTLVGMLVFAIAAPTLLVFSRMQKPPSKSSFALSLLGGLMIAISGFFRGALGGETYVFSTAGAMFILIFLLIVPIFLGATISISTLTRRRALVLFFSISSLIYSVWMYIAPVSEDVRLWVLPFTLAVTGSICGILSGLLIKRKT